MHNALKSSEKRKNTCIKKYGSETPFGSKNVRKKIIADLQEKYGVSNVSSLTSVKEKKKSTLLKNYGVDHPLKSDIIKLKIKGTMQSKYGVDHVSYLGMTQEQIDLLKDVQNIVDLNKEYNLYSISQQYGFSDRTLREIFEKNSVTPIHHTLSSFEKEVKDYISSISSLEITTDRTVLNGKEIDIYLPYLKLGIECNGAYWHSEISAGRGKDYHVSKILEAQKKSVELFQIWDFDWNSKKDIVKSMLSHKLGCSKKIFARKCKIRQLTKDEEHDFFMANHIQGYVPSKYAVGLVCDGVIYAAMSFSHSRYDKTIKWELLRFANKVYFSVIGGASRLLAHFLKNNEHADILSYSHRHISSGKLYQALGFEYVRSTGASYRYTKNYKVFFNRVSYQKHKLNSLLDHFDPTLTEWENMKNNGYDRIWDCGNDVWVLRGNK